MKLIRLYIEQFGGLRQYALDFEAGLTVIQAENGFGKTTLAEFIRAMFYGFPRKTKTLGKRQKYLPWAGGKSGGNLEFEFEGTRYRVERTFGATPKSDTFRLTEADTNRPSSRFTENLGLELFGLDADSFERSTYLPQNSLTEALTTDSIRAKLSDLVEDTGDVGNFEKAAAALRARRSSYALYRGVGGSVAEALGKISRLQMDLDRCRQAKDQLGQLREEIGQLEQDRQLAGAQLTAVRKEITQASEGAALAAVQKQHSQLREQVCQAEAALQDLENRYPQGFPRGAALEKARQIHLRLAARSQLDQEESEEGEARRRVEANRDRFAGGVPTREELDAQRRRCNEYLTLTAQASGCGLSPEEARELAQLRRPYERGNLKEERLEQLGETHRKLEWLREKYRELEDIPPVSAGKKSPLLFLAALALGIGSLVPGIVLLARGSYLPGGAAVGVGILALLLGAFLGIRGMITRELDRGAAVQQQATQKKAALQLEMTALAGKLEAALGQGEDYARAIMERHLQRERYLDLAAEEQRTAEDRKALLDRAAAAQRPLEAFLSRYFAPGIPPEQYHQALDTLARDGEAYLQAQGKLDELRARKSKAREEMADYEEKLDAFFRGLGIAREENVHAQLSRIEQDGLRHQELNQRLEQARQAAEAHRAAHRRELEQAPVGDLPDPAPLREREAALIRELDDMTESLLALRQRYGDLRETADRIPELEDQLEAWQERKQADQKMADLLDDTLGFLQEAKDSLASSYLGPIRAGFDRYLEKLSGTGEGRVLIDPDLGVQLERQGHARELGYFSAGQADLVMLCMRLALVDALFSGAKPVVILDDPFVNLDDRRTAAALKLLRELSRERQILYLVCNSSRGV